MTCKQVSEESSDFIDGLMPIARRVEFHAHIARCSECRTFLREMRMTRSLLCALGREAPPEPVRSTFLAMFRSFQATLASKSRPLPSAVPRALTWCDRVLAAARGYAPILATLLASIVMLVLVRPIPEKHIGLGAGLGCLEMEMLGGGLPLLGLFSLVWIRRRPIPAVALGFAAGFGALVCQASLHASCPRIGMHLHLGLFHFGGVATMIVLGSVAGLVQPASSPRPA